MVFFCCLFVANGVYTLSYGVVAVFLFLALFWLKQFKDAARFFRLNDEFNEIMAEATKRVDSGAPATELLEMAWDRLSKM